MKDDSILLSIVIPTKNRLETAVFAIQSALKIPEQSIEIIVQDCSDTNALGKEIDLLNDNRIKYFFQNDPINMTENWNRAYANSSGDFVLGIGDDDAVLQECFSIAKYAKQNNYDCIGQWESYHYFWPNFPFKGVAKRLLIRKFDGKFEEVNNLSERVVARLKYADDGYAQDLPMAYHRIVSRKLLNEIFTKTGKYFDATSLDVYSAFAFGLIAKKYAIVNYPYTMRGASGKSNSGRFVAKKAQEHFKEFDKIDYPEWLPQLPFVGITIAESMYKALKNLGREDLMEHISLPYLYASCLIGMPENKPVIEKYVDKFLDEKDKAVYNDFLATMKKAKTEKSLRNKLEVLNIYFPILSVYRFIIGKKIYKANNILDAIKIHENFMTKSNLKIQLPQ